MRKRNLVILGAVVGLGAAVTTLFTTKKGKEMQKHLLHKVDNMQEKLKEIEMSEVKQAITSKLDEVTTSINEFDWETPKDEIGTKYLEFKDKLKVIKDHLDVAKVKIDKDSTDEEKDFDLVIDKTQEAIAE